MRIERDVAKTCCVVLGMIAVYGAVVVWPNSQQKEAMAVEIQAKQAQLSGEEAPDLNPLQQEIRLLRDELEQARIDLPHGETPYAVLDRVSMAIRANQIGVYEINHRDAKVYARFALTPVDVEFDCGFTEAFDVIQRIERMQLPSRIERVEITGERDDPSGQVTVNLHLSSFFLPVGRDREGGQP